MKIKKKYVNLVSTSLMAFCMTFMMSFIMTLINKGLTESFVLDWMQTWGFVFIIALPVILIIQPLVKKTIKRVVIIKE